MRIKIPRKRIPDIIRYLEIVQDSPDTEMGLILDSEQGHFERVYLKKGAEA